MLHKSSISRSIRVQGARENNLKDVSVEIPRGGMRIERFEADPTLSCRALLDVAYPSGESKRIDLSAIWDRLPAPPCCLDGGDVDFLHGHHRLEGTLCLTAASRERIG